MDVNMFVGSAQSQASSVSVKSQSNQQSYQTMIQALQQFVGEGRLNSSAYNNGKRFYSAVLVPLVKAGILLSEAVGEACQKFVQDYQSTVDSGDLKSEELREKIRQLEFRISHLESIRSTIEGNDLPDNFKLRQLNQNSQAREALIDSKQVLQDKLDKLLEFHARSPEIFSAITELESIVDQGASQAGGAWTGSSFSIPTDLGWTTTVLEKWQIRADNIKKQEKEFHEAKIKELEKYNIYAWPYEDPVTKEIKVNWFIDKNGMRVFDDELQNYVEKYGKKLEGMYEIVGWEKIYELDLAARRKGDGKNYLTKHQVPKGWEWYSQTGAHVESAYWMASKTGLLDLALMAGLAYAGKQTKVPTSTNVANAMDDVGDVTKPRFGERKISNELYSELRKETPTPALRDKVNVNISLPMDDFAIPGKTINKRLEADHIVSMDRIATLDGFDQLTKQQQIDILNHPDNFVGLSRSANASKGPKSFEDWTTYKKENIPINPDFRQEMIGKEKLLEGQLQKIIDDLLKK